jgi:XTP/dITP diphosphohydrolase
MPASRLDVILTFEPSASRPNHLPEITRAADLRVAARGQAFESKQPPSTQSRAERIVFSAFSALSAVNVSGVRLLIATTNRNKVREIRALLEGAPVELLTLDAFSALTAPDETGRTFEENARLKALYYADATGELTVAEDSGLEIDALAGAPGVESARFGGAGTSYLDKFAMLYDALHAKGSATADGPARFVCALALAQGDRLLFETRGTVEGRIAPEPKGAGGFGYDPIFFYPPYGQTLGEATQAEKSAVSHRGKAFRALREFLVFGAEQSESHPRDPSAPRAQNP